MSSRLAFKCAVALACGLDPDIKLCSAPHFQHHQPDHDSSKLATLGFKLVSGSSAHSYTDL
eukprot:3651098-Amphidinium_carterae.1